MPWIYLSPHPDDAALSCGGLIWEQGQQGDRPEVWTIFPADPPPGALSAFARSLHERWQVGREAAAVRRDEDLLSCKELSARCRHFPFPEAIYRQGEDGSHLYDSEDAIFGDVHPLELPLVEELRHRLHAQIPADATLVCPLALGGHVDHRLTRLAAESLSVETWYYADYPYALKEDALSERLAEGGWQAKTFRVSEHGMLAWVRGVASHASQISTFWRNMDQLQKELHEYALSTGGVRLWKARANSS